MPKQEKHHHFFRFMGREEQYLNFACESCGETCRVGWNTYRFVMGMGPRK